MKLLHSYHNHTFRCHHAEGTEREYIEEAIRCGVLTIGFSDHTPYPFTNGFVSHSRMAINELESYVQTILDLKHAYRDEIDIRLGLEVEYYPEFFEEWRKCVASFPFEYFLLGQHYIGNEYERHSSGATYQTKEDVAKYVDQIIAALEQQHFLYLAHPDLLKFAPVTPDEVSFYTSEMHWLCRAVKAAGIPLEINLLGIAEKRWYPRLKFWEIAGKEGCVAVLGADAHQPFTVYRPNAVQKAVKLAAACGIAIIDTPLL